MAALTLVRTRTSGSRTNAAMPPPARETPRTSPDRRLAAGLFAVLVLAAAMIFGAVDRVVQVGLVFGLAIGFLLHPPEVPRLSSVWAWLGVGLAVFVAVSQFLPFQWFGPKVWHTVLSKDYDVGFAFTRNPEPGRALDCVLMAALAVGWFFWVRTLACDHVIRVQLIWGLFGTAACVAGVSLALGTRGDFMIYGMRYTPGWSGFGPFPNRNHTAALLAMGALAGMGCLVRGARRKHWVQLVVAIIAEAVIMVALLESKSRGGLLGLMCGAVVFAVLAISKLRSKAAVAGAVAGGLLCATLVFSFGSKVMSRFETAGDGNIPDNVRWEIWQDAKRVWHDAPLWGHGLGTFAQIFPFYQTVAANDEVILHPESSWLLWLDEMGAVPVGIGGGLLLIYIFSNASRAVGTGERGFFLRAGAFAGVMALLCHGIWDVPAHRWGTAGFGIALLAIACAPPQRRGTIRLDRLWAGAPALIGIFWLLPYMGDAPRWSEDGTRLLLGRLHLEPMLATEEELKGIEKWFPLNADLHEQIGLREMDVPAGADEAWREFRVADRLSPVSWALPATQGWLSRQRSPGMSYHFWSMSIERAGKRAPEIYLAACRNSMDLPGGEAYWKSYAESNPEFLLCYADAVSTDEKAKEAYNEWWTARGNSDAKLEAWEAPSFYTALKKWGTKEQLEIWMARRPELAAADYRMWATVLHEWRMDADAWGILKERIKEPAYPDIAAEAATNVEAAYVARPNDPVAAQAYARLCATNGDGARGDEVILAIAGGKNPPEWFLEKAAYLYAGRKDFSAAVVSMLNAGAGG